MGEEGKTPAKRRYFFDCEFVDKDEQDFQLEVISIAVVSEDDQEFYAINEDFDPESCDHEWLQENVIPKLPDRSDDKWMSIEEIRQAILDMIEPAETIEFWARNGSQDHFILCKIFNGMGRLRDILKEEKGADKVVFRDTHELRRIFGESAVPPLAEEDKHDALVDARHEKKEFDDWSRRPVRPKFKI